MLFTPGFSQRDRGCLSRAVLRQEGVGGVGRRQKSLGHLQVGMRKRALRRSGG